MVVLKCDGETMRSLCGMLVSGGDRCGCRNGLGELRKGRRGKWFYIIISWTSFNISIYVSLYRALNQQTIATIIYMYNGDIAVQPSKVIK